jgi:hypothetical protein
VIVGLDVRRLHQRNRARIDHDEFRAGAQATLHLRREHGMRLGGTGADDHDHVGVLHRDELLRARGFAHGVFQAVAGGRMADARAGVDVVGAEGRAHQLLHQERFPRWCSVKK